MVRCPDCYDAVIDELYIDYKLRAAASDKTRYPAKLDELTPWPLRGLTLVVTPIKRDDFKLMAWRSLAPHRQTRPPYVYLTLDEMADAVMGNNPRLNNSGLSAMALIILHVTGTESTKSDFPTHVLLSALHRASDGQGLWLYSGLAAAALGEKFGYAVKDMLPKPTRIG